MDWLTPVLDALDRSEKIIRDVVETRMNKGSATLNDVSLHKFYEEVETVESILFGEDLVRFKNSISILEDFLCICKYDEGIEVQNLLTLTMSAYICCNNQENSPTGSSTHLIGEAKRHLENAVKRASKTKAQLNYVRAACSELVDILLDGVEVSNVVRIG